MNRFVLAATLLFTGLSQQPLQAANSATSSITVTQAWLRATPNGAKVAGGYVTIVNAGPRADRLIAASIPEAPKGEVHTMAMENGVMHMARLENGLTIAAGATVTLQPGGDHLMFLNPAAPLKEGASVAGSLTFAEAGTIPVTFAVAGMAGKTPPQTVGSMNGMNPSLTQK